MSIPGLTQKYPSLRGYFTRSNPTEKFWKIAAPQSGLAMTFVRKSCIHLTMASPTLSERGWYHYRQQNRDLAREVAFGQILRYLFF
ncbi:MAG: hypothetical protein AABZ32_07715 [Bacteroidota bacterium]